MYKNTLIALILILTSLFFLSCGDTTTEFEKNFAISLKPAKDFVVQGDSISFSVELIPVGGFNSSVELSISGVPDSVEAYFVNSTLTPPASTDLWMKADSAALVDKYTLTLSGSGGGKENSQTVMLYVVEKIYELTLYFNKVAERRELVSDKGEVVEKVEETAIADTITWSDYFMNQDLAFNRLEVYLNFSFVGQDPSIQDSVIPASIHFEVRSNDSVFYAAEIDTELHADTLSQPWDIRRDVPVGFTVELEKYDEIKFTLWSELPEDFLNDVIFRYGKVYSYPYIRFRN